MFFYGLESMSANEHVLKTFRAAAVDCQNFTTVRRSPDLGFATSSYGPDVDSDIDIVSRHVAAARGACHSNPELRKCMRLFASAYAIATLAWRTV